MPAPAHVRTWQFQVNQFFEQPGTYKVACQNLMFAIKEAMKGNGSWTDNVGAAAASSGNWVVKSACDGSGGAGSFGNSDNVDRWVAPANLIAGNPGVNHSWIVLEQVGIPGAVGNLQVCIDMNSTNVEYTANIVVSPSAGFGSGVIGTATARPTATDEQSLNAAVSGAATATRWGGPSGTTNHTMLHVFKTSDGTAFRAIMTRGANNGSGVHTVGYWMFELPISIPSWTNPFVAMCQASDTITPGDDVDNSTAFGQGMVTWGRTPGGTNFSSGWMSLGQTGRGEWARTWGDSTTTMINHNDTAPMMSIALWSATVNARGRNGRLVDIYQSNYQYAASSAPGHQGRTLPAGGLDRQWRRFGEYWQPWNGSVPVVVA